MFVGQMQQANEVEGHRDVLLSGIDREVLNKSLEGHVLALHPLSSFFVIAHIPRRQFPLNVLPDICFKLLDVHSLRHFGVTIANQQGLGLEVSLFIWLQKRQLPDIHFLHHAIGLQQGDWVDCQSIQTLCEFFHTRLHAIELHRRIIISPAVVIIVIVTARAV